MDDKIKRLTDKILAEGVEKGKQQADKLLSEATQECDTILAKAQENADKLLTDAQKQVSEMKKNAEGELRLAANQTLQSLKSAIADDLSGKLSSLASEKIAQDKEVLFELIKKIVSNWTPGESLSIETADAEALTQYFKGNAKDLLERGVTIKEVASRETSFTLKPEKGSFKIEFGEAQLRDLFQSFLRPQLIDLLF